MTSRATLAVFLGLLAYDAANAAAPSEPAPNVAPCTYATLAKGTPIATNTQGRYRFTQTTAQWSAVAVRGFNSDHWDFDVYDNSGESPECFLDLLATTNGIQGADVIVGDFNHFPLNTNYVQHPGGAMQPGQIEWDDEPTLLQVDGPPVVRSVPWNEVVETWQIDLVADQFYRFRFAPQSSGATLLVFGNYNGNSPWQSRGDALLETVTSTLFYAEVTGRYGVVVLHDTDLTGDYSLAVCSTQALSNNVPVQTNDSVYQFPQAWYTAVALRSQPGQNWGLEIFDDSNPGACYGNLIASDDVASRVDLVVGPYDSSPARHARGMRNGSPGAATLEWEDPQPFTLNAPPVIRPMDSSQVIEAWYVDLEYGTDYTFDFVPQGADLKLLLFHSGQSWLGRASAQFETSTTLRYVVPFTSWPGPRFGIVILNENGGTGSYSLRIQAECDDDQLASDVLAPHRGISTDWGFNQTQPRWAGVAFLPRQIDTPPFGTRSLVGYASTVPWPACLGTLVASSPQSTSYGLIVGDFHANPLGTYHVRSESNYFGELEWDDGGTTVVVNGPEIAAATQALDMYDVVLQGGVGYRFRLTKDASAPSAPLNVSVFRNPGTGPYWAARGQEAFTWSLAQPNGNLFVAPATGTYGLAVHTDLTVFGYTFPYRLSIDDCATVASVVDLPMGSSVPMTGARGDFHMLPTNDRWTGVVLQSTNPWTIAVHDPPACNPVDIASESGPSSFDFLVGDHRSAAPGPLNLTCTGPATNTTVARSAWLREIYVNDVTEYGGPGTTNLDLYTVGLEAGLTYDFEIATSFGRTLLLFRGNGSWQGRSARLLETTTTSQFTATATDEYLIAVAGQGPYTFNVRGGAGVCGDGVGKGKIGVYADAAGTQSCFTLPPNTTMPLYVIAELAGPTSMGIAAAEFRLEFSRPNFQGYVVYPLHSGGDFIPGPGASMSGSPLDVTPGVDAEDPNFPAGATISFPTCQGSQIGDKILLGTFYLGRASGMPEVPLEVRVMPAMVPSVPQLCRAPLLQLCDVGATRICTTTDGNLLGRDPILSRTYINTPTCTSCGPSMVSDADPTPPPAPLRLAIDNVPDPFNPTTEIRYTVPEAGNVHLVLYDVSGRRVRTLVDERREAGVSSARWDGRNEAGQHAPSGIYFARLVTRGGTVADRLTLVR